MKMPSRQGFTLIEIMIVVAIIGILTAITLPSIRDAIDRSRLRACNINRKNIDGAKVQWAVDQKRPLTDVPADADLFGQGTYIEHKPECPSGGAYALNAVDDRCTCSIPPHR